jgi:3-oxoacyl-[acyl-carrier-protein] synthase II
MRRRVVVTGMGVVTPVGIDVDRFWQAHLLGVSGIRREELCHLSGLPCAPVSGRVHPGDVAALRQRPEARGRRWIELATGDAVRQALRQAGLVEPIVVPAAVVTTDVVGTSVPEFRSYIGNLRRMAARVPLDRPSLQRVLGRAREPRLHNVSLLLADLATQLRGPIVPLIVEATCATGARVLAEAARLIEMGMAEVAVAAASSARLTQYIFGTYAQMSAITRWPGPPEEASKPFDRRRDGMVLAEGAGAMVLESSEHAQKRGATPLARLCGWGIVNGGAHPTAPAQALITRTITRALAHAGTSFAEIDAVSTHGTSTRLNDQHESAALRQVFGDRVGQMGFWASKAILGHSSIAAGLIESVAAVLAVREGRIPPVRSCREPDPACGIPFVSESEARPVQRVLKNAFGFGGQYAAIIFARD